MLSDNVAGGFCVSVMPCSEEISQHALNKIRGIDNHKRLDEELYQDYEDNDAQKVLISVMACIHIATSHASNGNCCLLRYKA